MTEKAEKKQAQAVFTKYGLSSIQQIEAANIFAAVIFLRKHMAKNAMRIHEVTAENIAEWI